MNPIIKSLYAKIRAAEDADSKALAISELKDHIATLSPEEQAQYRQSVLNLIESKFEVMDKLIEAYEVMKKDFVQFA